MHHLSARLRSLSALLSVLLLTASVTFAQAARSLVVDAIDERRMVTLSGHLHPLAQPQYESSTVPDEHSVQRMLLRLSRTAEQQAALLKLLEDQQNPASPDFRRWLTPSEFGQRFGAADNDLAALTGWLEGRGFAIERVAAARNLVEFSGTAAQLRSTFHTDLRQYTFNGQVYLANAGEPSIPAAFAPLVRGFASLNNFPRKRLSHPAGNFVRTPDNLVAPQYTVTSGGQTYYAVGPADFAVIYNTAPLLQSGTNGAGHTIVLLGRSNVRTSDITDFRTLFALGAGNTKVILDGPDPGIVAGDEDESVLDLEWASAAAPGATVLLVSAAHTSTTSGLDLAAAYAIEHNLGTVISESYGLCEAYLGTSGNAFMEELWQQAAAQGTSVTIASGDSGAALCDNPNTSYVAANGLSVNGLASTSYNVAVGGTDFDDAGTQSTYWNAQNTTTTHASARSYIPEMAWNESCAASATASSLNVCPLLSNYGTPAASLNLWAGSGGASNCVASTTTGPITQCLHGRSKPSWQAGPGVPADGVRHLPDVALLSAANSDSRSFYVVCQADKLPAGYSSCKASAAGIYFSGAGGTSAAAPSFAGIIALAAQKADTRLGNVNALLYSLAASSGASCASSVSSASSCLFHDVVKGNISVPCAAGSPNCSVVTGSSTGVLVTTDRRPAFEASSGYDLATGLGSVNAAALAAAIAAAPAPAVATVTSLSLNGSSTSLSARHGDLVQINVAVSPSAATGAVSLTSANGTITSAPLGTGSAAWSSRLFPGGSYTLSAHYAGDAAHAASNSNSIAVSLSAESSRTLVNLVSLDQSGTPIAYGSTSIAYGSNYLLRVDIGDAAMASSLVAAPTSTCASGEATCPTGSVSLTADGTAVGTGSKLLSRGSAIYEGLQLPAGSHHLAAAYGDDAGYTASSGVTDVVISKAHTAVTATTAAGAYEYGVPLSVTAQLATTSYGASPSGTITLFDNGAQASGSLQSVAQLSTPGVLPRYAALAYSGQFVPPSLGSHTLSVAYAGDNDYAAASSGPISISIGPATTLISATSIAPASAAPGDSVSFSVTIASASALEQPTGTVTFYDNGTPIAGTVHYGGNAGPGASLTASIAASFSGLGQHTITAAYSGDSHYKAASQALGVLPVQRPLGLSLPVSQIASNGGASSVLLNVANTTAAPLPITLSCTPSSSQASCSVSPATLNLAASTSITASVVYTVPALSAASVFHLSPLPLALAMISIGIGVCIRSTPYRVMLLLFVIAALLFAAACGGGTALQSSTSATSPPATHTYTFTISAASGSYTNSQVLTVTVH